ncbi:hypothetical protein [Roseivirga sp.]|uniref:hypothetical protein n=1 Tax=Roseivirga sp. TaxID=1964215 RepID=UPI003B52DE13
MKALHIHCDPKFIKGSKNLFGGDFFENEILFFGSENFESEYIVTYAKTLRELDREFKHKIANVNIVVFWGLNDWVLRLFRFIPGNVLVIWRFFGYELYGRIPSLIYTQKTKAILSEKSQIRNLPKRIINKFRHLIQMKVSFRAALERVDTVLMISEMEYQMLNTYWSGKLPRLLVMPSSERVLDLNQLINNSKEREKRVIIGHSRNSINNHIELFDLIRENEPYSNTNFEVLFNYGGPKIYADKVKEFGKDTVVHFIEDFMSRDEFKKYIMYSSAFVTNSLRQCAGATIFLAIEFGLKIYMNTANIHSKWLKSEGFLIFSLEDFARDLGSEDFFLSEEKKNYNRNQLLELLKKNNFEDFSLKLYSQIEEFVSR